MRHAFRDFSRFLRGKPSARAKARPFSGFVRSYSEPAPRLEPVPVAGDSADAHRLAHDIAETVRQEIDRLDGYLAYHHERTVRELEARIGPRIFYSSPTVDAIVSYGALDLVVPTSEAGLLAHIMRHGVGSVDPAIRALIDARVRPGAAIVEIGAGIGLHTLLLATAAGPSGQVDSFERAPHLAAALGRSIRLNGFADRVTVHREEAGALDAHVPRGARVDLALIAGDCVAPDGLEALRPIAAENPHLEILCAWSRSRLIQHGGDPAGFEQDLRSLGFSPYRVEATQGGLPTLTPLPSFVPLETGSILLTRQGEAA
jgi:hypothetical protein